MSAATPHGATPHGATHRSGTPHELVNPPELAAPVGFSHAVAAGPGRTVYLGGQAALHPDGTVDPASTLVGQFDLALANLAATLAAAGAGPEHLVTVTVFATDAEQYRKDLKELGAVWRRRLGRHYPAMAFFEVKGLFDPAAQVELTGVAVVPDGAASGSAAPGSAASGSAASGASVPDSAASDAAASGPAAPAPETP